MDTNGHGTHVAGIIAGSGVESTTVTNASGSVMPAVDCQFRGMAPARELFVMAADPNAGPVLLGFLSSGNSGPDQCLHLEQQLALRR